MIALDLSRLLSRAASATPSGIDRVEMAYARYLLAGEQPHCFAARNALGQIGALPDAKTREFVTALAALWSEGGTAGAQRATASLAGELRRAALFGGRTLERQMQSDDRRSVYLLVSHQNLDRPRPIARLKAVTNARFLCFIHDLIPLEFPEHTRPGQRRRHRRRIDTAGALADAILVNSAATQGALERRLKRPLPITVAPLGVELCNSPESAADRPYFVCIATIEARKNHGLLLDLWHRLSAELGEAAPRLLLIGQRGWKSAEIDSRVAALRGLVTEHRDLADRDMVRLLRGARALLLPSLAEGFGLPVAEALAMGVPVICSDLPALRETGGSPPDYLDPGDAAGWHAAILDYATDTPRRQRQFARMAGWRPPHWSDHFTILERVVAELT